MATNPTSVEIRSYQVGFGDCYLLTFVYPSSRRHVLIDFGSTGLTPSKKKGAKVAKKVAGKAIGPKIHMRKVADAIAEHCGKDGLTAVIATHRHADHINGFGTETTTGESGTVIRGLKPRLVLQPWTEDPSAKRDATRATADSSRSRKSFAAGLSAMHQIAQGVYDLAKEPPSWMSARLQKQLMFLGMENIKNLSAVNNLIAMGKAKGATAVWAHHGSNAGLGRLLPGVKVSVLGPPNLVQSEKIRKQRSRDPDQFWHLVAAAPSMVAARAGAHLGARKGKRSKALPVPAEARWFRDRLEQLNGQQLLEIVRSLDAQMNNTSLILLFEVFGKKLLFPGDAQIENWSYALEDAPNAEQTKKVLADVDVYKVGHHGSLNATPKTLLWDNFKKRKGKKLQTLLSTMPGKHGHTDSETEVPRRTLITALKSETRLSNTMDLKFGEKAKLCLEITVTP